MTVKTAKRYGALIMASGEGKALYAALKAQYPNCRSALAQIISSFHTAGVQDISLVASESVMADVRGEVIKRGLRFLPLPERLAALKQDALSLACFAMKELKGQQDALFIVSENTPFFRPETLTKLMEAKDFPVSPAYDGIGGHPLLIEDSMIPLIIAAASLPNEDRQKDSSSGNRGEGLRGALRQAGLFKHHVAVDDEGCILTLHSDLAAPIMARYLSVQPHQAAAKILLSASSVFFGPGAAQLLRLIQETGSVRDASERMGISYSKAWRILRTIAEQSGQDAVIRRQGGAEGGSAELSPSGLELLERYSFFNERCQSAIQEIHKEIFQF